MAYNLSESSGILDLGHLHSLVNILLGETMVRELSTLCLAPVLLAGALFSTDVHFSTPSKNKTEIDNAGVVQAMTCETGPGIGLKASTTGLYGLDLQYGLTYKPNATWSLSVLPKLGLSATHQAVKELPQYVQFGLGIQLLLGYEEYRLGIELWHLSNGSALGLNVSDKPNIGLNLPLLTIGKVF